MNIEEIQTRLFRLGLNPGPADGIMGRRTKQATEQFQKRAGLSVGVACPGVGNEFALTGKMLNARALGGQARLQVTNYDNTSPVATGAQGMLTVVCELS